MNKKACYPPYHGMLIDSHCHLIRVLPYDEGLCARLCDYPARCILDVGISPSDWDERVRVFSGITGVHFSVGLHPCMYAHVALNEAHAQIE